MVKVVLDSNITVIKEYPEDDKIIECAVSAGADYIVSGDMHLLELGKYREIKIEDFE